MSSTATTSSTVSIDTALVRGGANAPFGVYLIALVLPATIAHVIGGTMSEHLALLSEPVAGTIRVLLIGSVMGALSGAVFWFIGVYEPGRTTRHAGTAACDSTDPCRVDLGSRK